MGAIVLDAEEMARPLEAAGMSPAQAGAVARVLKDILASALAGPQTLEAMVADVREEAARRDGEVRLALAEHKAATQDKLEALRGDIHVLRGEMYELRIEMERRFSETHTLIQTSYRMLLMWMVGTQIGGLALITAIILQLG
jgi:hypothetical protein